MDLFQQGLAVLNPQGQAHVGMLLLQHVQPGQQQGVPQIGLYADRQDGFQLIRQRQLLLGLGPGLDRGFRVMHQLVALGCQQGAIPFTDEQGLAQLLFQGLYSRADGGLGDVQTLGAF